MSNHFLLTVIVILVLHIHFVVFPYYSRFMSSGHYLVVRLVNICVNLNWRTSLRLCHKICKLNSSPPRDEEQKNLKTKRKENMVVLEYDLFMVNKATIAKDKKPYLNLSLCMLAL